MLQLHRRGDDRFERAARRLVARHLAEVRPTLRGMAELATVLDKLSRHRSDTESREAERILEEWRDGLDRADRLAL